jgi:alpha-beta hydrolase superfamily lysophospholipase
MDFTEEMIHSDDAVELYLRIWPSASDPQAAVIMTHGHGEHIGRYEHLAEALAGRGFQCFGYDLRGHGRSSGQKGYLESWADYHQDLISVLNRVLDEEAECPIFLYGHSLGGVVALEYCLQVSDGIRGVIASGPAIGKPNIPEILFVISRLLSRIYPTFTIATQLETAALSRIASVVRAYEEDPLVHDRGTARMGTELTATADWIQEHVADWSLPLLILHGEKDRLINPADSRRFYNNVPIEDKTYLELKDGYHEPHNDLEKEFVIQRIGDWIEAHL